MAEVTKRTLIMAFGTPAGGEVKLTINKPKDGLTGSQISAAMDQIIASNALGEAQLVSTKNDAKFVIQETESIELGE